MRNIYPQNNGDIELGDYPARIDPDWCNVVWVICHACNQRCPYCVGYSNRGEAVSLLSEYSIGEVAAAFSKLAETSKKKLYITISGGEPTLVPELPQLCRSLGDMEHKVELQTNLLDDALVDRFINAVPTRFVGQIMATYHGWRLDKNDELRAAWMRNFHHAWERGYTIVLKTVVLPDEVEAFPEKKKWLQAQLPDGAPILPWVFLKGMPRSLQDFNGAYPYSYTPGQQAILDQETEYRAETQRWYRAGSGFYRGMPCDGGRGFVYLDVKGNLYRCFNAAQMKPPPTLGNIMTDEIKLHSGPVACPIHFCSTAFWPLWFGQEPWKYVPRWQRRASNFLSIRPGNERGKYL
jgi:hypothetical protein